MNGFGEHLFYQDTSYEEPQQREAGIKPIDIVDGDDGSERDDPDLHDDQMWTPFDTIQRSTPASHFHECCGRRNNLPHATACPVIQAGEDAQSRLAAQSCLRERCEGLEYTCKKLRAENQRLKLTLDRIRQDLAMFDVR